MARASQPLRFDSCRRRLLPLTFLSLPSAQRYSQTHRCGAVDGLLDREVPRRRAGLSALGARTGHRLRTDDGRSVVKSAASNVPLLHSATTSRAGGHRVGIVAVCLAEQVRVTGRSTTVGAPKELDAHIARNSEPGPERPDSCSDCGGDDGNRTRVRGFADRSLNHSGTSPLARFGWLPREDSNLGSRIQSPLSYH